MFAIIWAVSIRAHGLLRWAPTNLVLDRIRTRRGLKWGVPAMLLALPLLLGAATCAAGVRDGGPGWLNLLVILFIWDALKFLVIGPISFVALIRIYTKDALTHRR